MCRKLVRVLVVLAVMASISLATAAHAEIRLIVKLKAQGAKSSLTPKARIDKLAAASALPLTHLRRMAMDADVVSVEGLASNDTSRALGKLRADPNVEWVELDHRRRPEQSFPVNDEYIAAQRYLTNATSSISAFSAWDTTHGSSAIVVAVLDTGYRPHAAMAGRILPGIDVIASPTTANDGNGRDSDASDPGDYVLASEATDDCPARDSSWHGTAVAGVIAANTNDGVWTAGIDWAAKILPVRVLGKCGGYDSDIADGIAWAAGLSVPGLPINTTPAHVINLSLGGDESCPSIYRMVVPAAYARGVTRAIVAAAGNESDDVSRHSPASCPGVIAVASTTTITGNLARYSNSGAGITISAPGGTFSPALPTQGTLVLSNTGRTTPGDDAIVTEGGTSFSAPMVAGAISLMLAVAPSLTADQVLSMVRTTAKPFAAGSDCTTARCGAGILDAGAAVRAAATLAVAMTPNYEGLWWNAPAGSESGWGINFAHQADVIFATWFTYDVSGKPWWLSMTANRTAANVFSGPLYQTRGPAFSTVPFDPAAVIATAVGSATLTFNDVNNATFAYTVNGIAQTKSITRQVFGPLPTCTFGALSDLTRATNYQDLWWAAPAESESGWGVNFTQQGDIIFATWFTYDVDGSPLWLSATANRTSAGVYTGTINRTTGPAFNAVPFDMNRVVATPVGTLTLTFANGDAGTFAYTVSGIAQTKSITRQVFRAPGTVCQ